MKRYLLILCLAMTACSDLRANADFVNAVQLIEQAESATSAEITHSLLLKAREALHEIVTMYSSIDVAVKLAPGEGLGSVSMQSLDVMIIEKCSEEPNYDCVIAIALQTANSIDDDWEKGQALAMIASAQAKAGDMKVALQTANGIDDDNLKAVTLAEIANIQAEGGDMQAAIEAANSINNDWRKAQALAMIASAQAKVGDMKAALQTANSIDIDWKKAVVLIDIAGTQAGAG